MDGLVGIILSCWGICITSAGTIFQNNCLSDCVKLSKEKAQKDHSNAFCDCIRVVHVGS